MLRITQTAKIPACATLSVEGRIAAQWIHVLQRQCDARMAADCDVVLDLAKVSFVDCAGILMLRTLASRRVQIVNASPLVRALLAAEKS